MTETVYLFDVDNTLLDNDAVIAGLHAQLVATVGASATERYWALFEALRAELGYADYLGALQRLRVALHSDPRLHAVASFLLEQPFADRIYEGALDALAHVGRGGPTVILSDGDAVFQPHKIRRAGLREAVDGRVLICIHKEQMLADLEQRYPAQRYVMVDDKLHILTAMKAALGDRLTTVFVRQGHYAHDLAAIRDLPEADRSVERIGDLATLAAGWFTATPANTGSSERPA